MELIDVILSKGNLNRAYKKVVANKGASGVDGVTVEELGDYIRKNKDAIVTSIRNRTYMPKPVRRVYIPKDNGKQRPLGIPTALDRTIQQAIAQPISDIYEEIFSEYSYGFRPGKSCHDAIRQALCYLNSGLDIVFDTISNVITAILAIYILLKMQIGMFFVVFFLQLIVIWSQLKFTNILVEKTKKIRLKQDGIYASMQQYLGNIIVVILNKAKLLFFSEFVKKERSYQKECAELDIQYAVFDQIGSLFSSIIRVFIYTYGGMKIIKSQMTMGELIAFIEYTTLFINPCIRILKSNASIQKLKVSINRIYDFLEMKNSIAQNNYGIKIRNRINEIVFDNVSFSYDKKMVIENLSFKLERGKTYAFVGETGCGKSTIVNLLFRLWDTKSGNIMIDGENIKEYNLFSLRKQLSIATQNVYIKDDSIENNILMGRKKEDCAYDEICKLVGMESILSKFPKEKDVSVGENGNKLSGGQKQRIAMARALVHADNVLILDEATSALDNITQNEIMKNIKPLYQDKIVIIITHRLDTISDVDKIFVMSEGRICEEGQHNELMKKGEKYYALVQNL